MSRILLLLALAAGGTPLHAQDALFAGPPTPPPKDGKVVIPLTLTPAAVKKPVSRYYLTPQYTEMKPGNRVPTFLRAFAEQDAFFAKEQVEKRAKWNEMRLEDLPLDEIKTSGAIGGLAYRPLDADQVFRTRGRPLGDVDEGARQLTADWQIWFNLREDGIGTLLPEVQKMRQLADVLKLRMRYEIRTGDVDRAIYSARTFYGLASAFESHPTLIALLVGLAVESIGLDALEELVQRPTCPNLYWSFTEIPPHVLSTRTAHGGEQILAETLFQPFLSATGPLPDAEVLRQLKILDTAGAMTEFLNTSGVSRFKYTIDAPLRSVDKKKVAAAKQLLIDTGTPADRVTTFTDLQVIVTADVRQYEVLLADVLATATLPYPEAKKIGEALDKRLQSEGGPLARLFVPGTRSVMNAQVRVRQRVAILRVVEAIRLYAHEHGGRLPAKLADVSVPVPLDPVTEKEFEYSVADGVATLHGANPDANKPQWNRYYEIRLAK